MARKLKVRQDRKDWLALGIEKRARALSNQNALENTGVYINAKYRKNEARIAKALSNMRKKASTAAKARGSVSG